MLEAAADLVFRFEDGNIIAVCSKQKGNRESGGAGADNGDFFLAEDFAALGIETSQIVVGDELFNAADMYRCRLFG